MFFSKKSAPSTPSPAEQSFQNWNTLSQEGQLALDIFRDDDILVIRSPLAGIDPEQLDIAIDGDLLTIRGSREQRREVNEDDWFLQECYWGSFSRSVILPLDVISDQAEATVKNGVLEIRLPIQTGKRLKIRALDEEGA